jgi:hypothetical protein
LTRAFVLEGGNENIGDVPGSLTQKEKPAIDRFLKKHCLQNVPAPASASLCYLNINPI